MKILKKLFGKKKEEVEEKQEPEITTVEKQTPTGKVCDHCGFEIFGEQKSIKKAGKRFHLKPCYKNIQKLAKKHIYG